MKQPKNKYKNSSLPEYDWGGIINGLTSGGGGLGAITGVANIMLNAIGNEGAADAAIEKEKKDVAAQNLNFYGGAAARNPMGLTTTYPYGGMVAAPNAELEGGEVLRTPDGGVDTTVGPSHQQGGVPMALPPGTEVFSDRIKIKGTKLTYAQAASKIEKQMNKYDKLDDDMISKKTKTMMKDRLQGDLDTLFMAQEMQKRPKIDKAVKKYMGETGASEGDLLDAKPHTPVYAAGGTTGWPPYNPHAFYQNMGYPGLTTEQLNQIEDANTPDVIPSTTNTTNTGTPYSTFPGKQPIRTVSPILNKINQTSPQGQVPQYHGPYNPGLFDDNLSKIPTAKASDIQIPNQVQIPNQLTGSSLDTSNIDGGAQGSNGVPKKQFNTGDVLSKITEVAPMIYNLMQKAPEGTDPSAYMNTNFITPQRMDDSQLMREVDRSYAALINDKSLTPAQRMMAARQRNAAQAQIGQQTNNAYKQEMTKADEFNAGLKQTNIGTALKIKDMDDADYGAYANMKAQAAGDISQAAQKWRLEGNMRQKNEQMQNALKTTFPNYTFNPDGSIVYKSTGKPLESNDLAALQNYIYSMQSTMGQYPNMQSGYNPMQTYYDMNTGVAYNSKKKKQ